MKTLQLHPSDNVAVVIDALKTNDTVNTDVMVSNPVPVGHKMAIKNISSGENVLKYGQIIGTALADINAGEHVHNLGMGEHKQSYNHSSAVVALDAATTQASF